MFSRFFLRKRLSDLEDEVAKLARIVQEKDMDWQEMRARCRRLMDRTEHAARRVEATEITPETPTDGEPDYSKLTPAQRRLQEMVNNRRKLLGMKREAS